MKIRVRYIIYNLYIIMPQETINDVTWNYTTYLENGNTYASIGTGSWRSATADGSALTGSVTIPNTLGGFSVRIIENHAFYQYFNLTSVFFESGSQLTTIGELAFYFAGLSGNITFPASLKSIGKRAFNNCSGLTSASFDSGSQLEMIGGSGFSQTGLNGSITLPASLKTVGGFIFAHCYNLTTVTFESGSLTAVGTVFDNTAFNFTGITTVNAHSNTITAMNWTISDSTSPPTLNIIGNKDGITVVDISPSPTCFPAGTPIQTDQGVTVIEQLVPGEHTLRGKSILAITQTRPLQKHIVCFEKDSIGKNVPSQQTLCSKEHKVLYKGEMIKARDLADMCKNVKKVSYNGETLYNVLLEKHGKMLVNNMICETLHPENIAAKFAKAKSSVKRKAAHM